MVLQKTIPTSLLQPTVKPTLEHLPIATIYLDSNLCCVYVNHTWQELSNQIDEESYGDNWQNVIHSNDRKKILNLLKISIEEKCNIKIESRIQNIDNKELWVFVQTNFIPATEENSTTLCVTFTDINSIKVSEAAYSELTHMERLNIAGEMASSIAHEINQPLTTIVHYTGGCLARLENQSVPLEIISVMKKIIAHAERAGKVIHRLKNFVRKGDVHKKLTDINELIVETLTFMQYQLSQNRVDVQLQLSKQIKIIELDRTQIQQVLINLVNNAIDAILKNTSTIKKIIVTTKYSEEFIIFSVEDSGKGMSDTTLAKIFEAFHTTKANGMGMGLAISKTIIDAHAGDIQVKSILNVGTIFTIKLPIQELEHENK